MNLQREDINNMGPVIVQPADWRELSGDDVGKGTKMGPGSFGRRKGSTKMTDRTYESGLIHQILLPES